MIEAVCPKCGGIASVLSCIKGEFDRVEPKIVCFRCLESFDDRRPPHPSVLMGADPDRPKIPTRGRVAKAVRAKDHG